VKIVLAVILLLAMSSASAVAQTSSSQHPGTHAAGVAAFQAMLPVLHHPRCMVCHSNGDYPRQGDDLHRHLMDIRRGPAGTGASPVQCSTCHQDHNLQGVHMPPGAADWHMPAPEEPMIWEKLSNRELCKLLVDPKRNGGRNSKAIEEHMRTPLVQWGWHPGEGRAAIPMPKEDFLLKVHEWTSAGSPCPAS
jgi:hypothetical protein